MSPSPSFTGGTKNGTPDANVGLSPLACAALWTFALVWLAFGAPRRLGREG